MFINQSAAQGVKCLLEKETPEPMWVCASEHYMYMLIYLSYTHANLLPGAMVRKVLACPDCDSFCIIKHTYNNAPMLSRPETQALPMATRPIGIFMCCCLCWCTLPLDMTLVLIYEHLHLYTSEHKGGILMASFYPGAASGPMQH